MHYILFDCDWRQELLPFTHTRPVADIRCGIFSFRERWERQLATQTYSLCPDYMQNVFSAGENKGSRILINGASRATASLALQIKALPPGYKLLQNDTLIAAHCIENFPFEKLKEAVAGFRVIEVNEEVELLYKVWDIFSKNGAAIAADFAEIGSNRHSAPLPSFVTAISPENIFVEEGAIIGPCIINASGGPVYIAKEAEIMEGCLLRGPIALNEHACLKMGAKVYGGTTIGPGCKVGGEVNNVVFFANSNKGHDGFIGNAVIGEWCNLGADTNCSNLKNNYDEVKIWSEQAGKLIDTGLLFCGLLMGDHSKSGINTMFNTGTVVGVSCNIYGSGFPEKFVPSFSWGSADNMQSYRFDKAMDTAQRMMARRQRELSAAEISMYAFLFNQQQ